jgi:hypothetical protein
MTAAEKFHHISAEGYLARELVSPIMDEYVGGVYAMAVARNVPDLIASNLIASKSPSAIVERHGR